MDNIPARRAIAPDCQTLADLRALIPAGASPDALRADRALLCDGAPIAPARFVPSLAFALLDGFARDPASDPDAALIWHFDAAAIRALSPGPRAILCAAFRLRVRMGLNTVAEVDVTDADCVSAPLVDLTAALLPIARDLSAEDIAVIAAADYGGRVEDHTRAIAGFLRHGGSDYGACEGWECLQLVSHVPGARGWAPCTAWIMIRALAVEDDFDDILFRWGRQAGVYLLQPSARRSAFLSAVRGLTERVPDWGRFALNGFDAPPPIPYEGPMF